MTREEASKVIKDGLEDMSLDFADEEQYEALTMAIKELEQEPCDDTISRQAVQDYIAKYLSQYLYDDVREAVEVIDEYIGDLPPVNPTKTGHWINTGLEGEIDEQIVRAFSCSECGAISIFRIGYKGLINSDLCPNCGAKNG